VSPGKSLENVPRYVSWLGAVLALEMLVEVAILTTTPALPAETVIVAGLVTSAPFAVGLIYGGYRLDRSSIGVERYDRIARWSLAGGLVFLLVNVAIMPTLPIASALQLSGWIRWAVSIGASVGFLIGSFEARAIHREVVAERGRLSHQRAESRRDLLDYMETLLDREIEPRTDAIADSVDELAERLEGDGAREAAAIGRRAHTLRSIVGHAEYLIEPDSDAPNLEPTNLTATLTDVIADRETPADVTIECDTPEDEEWYVLADRLLPEVFEHLVSCLVDEEDCSAARASVTCEATPETVTVQVGCEGVTIPEKQREALTNYAGGTKETRASELALVGMLVEYYGGTVELAGTGSEETVFEVTLRRVPVQADGQPTPVGNRRSASG
jgi:signal transduction histidine kinase